MPEVVGGPTIPLPEMRPPHSTDKVRFKNSSGGDEVAALGLVASAGAHKVASQHASCNPLPCCLTLDWVYAWHSGVATDIAFKLEPMDHNPNSI